MQVTELAAEGLKRNFKVVVPADDIEGRVHGRLHKLSETVRMPGFRPGKAPVKLLRKQYGRSVMGEVLEEVVNEGSQQAIRDRELRPALRPKIEVTSFDEGKDLEFTVALEVLPAIPELDHGKLALTRLVAEASEEQVQRALENLARASRDYAVPETPRPAQKEDQLVLDFVGRVDGEPFEGGSADDLPLVLGSGQMIPGFEDQLIGAEAGQEVSVEVTLPEAFRHEHLAGKQAVFTVTVKEIRAPASTEIDDELAKRHNLGSLDELRKALKDRLEQEYRRMTRARLKRQLLDQLAEHYVFEVPEGMVDLEFDAIWQQLTQEMERTSTSFESMGRTEDEVKAEYRAIAERRVRLGLLLSNVGTANDITVDNQELNAAVIEQARRYPGQEQQVVDFFRNNPQAVEQLRAPIFEDKVVDFILQLAPTEEQTVSVEELMREPDDDDPIAATVGAGGEPSEAPGESLREGSTEGDGGRAPV